MAGLEVVVGAILELDPHEVMVLRRSKADLKDKGRSVVGWMSVPSQYLWSYIYNGLMDSSKLGVLLDKLEQVVVSKSQACSTRLGGRRCA
jgi:hypothetical protein